MKTNLTRKNGFSLLEALIAIAVLSFGVLSLAAVYAQGILLASISQYDYVAEKKAEQAVEAIFAARDTGTLTWNSIQNVSAAGGNGVFLDGPQRILLPGNDGLVGTVNDAGQPDEVILTGPGPDGKIGTADDVTVNLNPWMTRTIAITPVTGESNLRQITVTVNFITANQKRSYVLVSYISSFT